MIALNPKMNVRFGLPRCHAGLPEAERPVFTTRRLTANELIEVAELAEQADGKLSREKIALLAKACALGLAGWSNVRHWRVERAEDIPFDPATAGVTLAEIATLDELNEMYMERLKAIRLTLEEKKSSESAEPSAPAPSAPAAGQASGAAA